MGSSYLNDNDILPLIISPEMEPPLVHDVIFPFKSWKVSDPRKYAALCSLQILQKCDAPATGRKVNIVFGIIQQFPALAFHSCCPEFRHPSPQSGEGPG